MRPSDAAAVFFSSGSTSKPKGIMSSHRGVAIQMWRFRRMCGFSPDDNVRCWSANGFFWSGNFVMSLGATLAAGGSLVLQPTFDAADALELMVAERVNYPFAWPHQWAQIEGLPNWLQVDLSRMRFADLKTPIARHPTVSAELSFPSHAYGNTETFTFSTAFDVDASPEAHADSWGVPLPGVTVKIVDPATGRVISRGESGEICVKGPTLMLGYLGTPLDETLDAEGFFHTGDGGYLDDADRLFWEGRLTEIIKTGGANVSPLEVDDALAKHPAVKLTKTVGLPHDTSRRDRCRVRRAARRSQRRSRRDPQILARTAGKLQGTAPRTLFLRSRDCPDRQQQDQVRQASRSRRKATVGHMSLMKLRR